MPTCRLDKAPVTHMSKTPASVETPGGALAGLAGWLVGWLLSIDLPMYFGLLVHRLFLPCSCFSLSLSLLLVVRSEVRHTKMHSIIIFIKETQDRVDGN